MVRGETKHFQAINLQLSLRMCDESEKYLVLGFEVLEKILSLNESR